MVEHLLNRRGRWWCPSTTCHTLLGQRSRFLGPRTNERLLEWLCIQNPELGSSNWYVSYRGRNCGPYSQMSVVTIAQRGGTPKDRDELVLFFRLSVVDITAYSREGQITECLAMPHMGQLLSLLCSFLPPSCHFL